MRHGRCTSKRSDARTVVRELAPFDTFLQPRSVFDKKCGLQAEDSNMLVDQRCQLLKSRASGPSIGTVEKRPLYEHSRGWGKLNSRKKPSSRSWLHMSLSPPREAMVISRLISASPRPRALRVPGKLDAGICTAGRVHFGRGTHNGWSPSKTDGPSQPCAPRNRISHPIGSSTLITGVLACGSSELAPAQAGQRRA